MNDAIKPKHGEWWWGTLAGTKYKAVMQYSEVTSYWHEHGVKSPKSKHCFTQKCKMYSAGEVRVVTQENKSLRDSEITLVNETEDLKCEIEDLREALVSLDAIASLMGSDIYEGSLLQSQVGGLLKKKVQ